MASYANVVTALADVAVTKRIRLGLQKKAATRIINLVNDGDQRERIVANRILDTAGVPQPYVDMVAIMLDLMGGVIVTSPTDTQIDTAVDTLWDRFIALVA